MVGDLSVLTSATLGPAKFFPSSPLDDSIHREKVPATGIDLGSQRMARVFSSAAFGLPSLEKGERLPFFPML